MKYAKEVWSPEYEAEDGEFYGLPDIILHECPVSFITSESRFLVELEGRMRRLKDSTGSVFLGTDSSAWPSLWADAVAAIEVQRVLENNARVTHEMEKAKRTSQHG